MKIKKMIYIAWSSARFNMETRTQGDWQITDCDQSSWNPDFNLKAKQEIEIEVPEVDALGELVESLQRKKNEIISKATKEAGALDEQIQQLLALPQSTTEEV